MFRRDEKPVYERDGMRLDVSFTDEERRGGHKNEYRDSCEPELGRLQTYNLGIMFSDDFQVFNNMEPGIHGIILAQWKHFVDWDHSPSVSIQCQREEFFFKFRDINTPSGPAESREEARTRIVRNKWYDFNMEVVWQNRELPASHGGNAVFKVHMNDKLIIDDWNIPNCYPDAELGPAFLFGPYIWDWERRTGDPLTQTVHYRL